MLGIRNFWPPLGGWEQVRHINLYINLLSFAEARNSIILMFP